MTLSPTPATPESRSSSSQSSACCSPTGCLCSPSESAPTAPTASASVESVKPSKSDSNASTNSRRGWLKLTVHRDNRGNVRETFRASWFPEVPPIKQLVRSKSKPKTLRGMHLHRKQWDVWHFVRGAALVRLFDHSSGRNDFIWAGPGDTIAIPPGLSHGFYTPDGCILLYALTEEYDGTDEYGWYFADGLSTAIPPEFQEEWPISTEGLNVSDRDVFAANLAEFDG